MRGNWFCRKVLREPGVEFEYSSGSTQLLGVLLENALKAKDPSLTISQHLSRSL